MKPLCPLPMQPPVVAGRVVAVELPQPQRSRKFGMPGAVHAAVWCRLLRGQEALPHLAIFHSHGAAYFWCPLDGAVEEVALPFPVAGAFPLAVGVLLQRGADASSSSTQSAWGADGGAPPLHAYFDHSAPAQWFVCFTALEEVVPVGVVAAVAPLGRAAAPAAVCAQVDPHERILGVVPVSDAWRGGAGIPCCSSDVNGSTTSLSRLGGRGAGAIDAAALTVRELVLSYNPLRRGGRHALWEVTASRGRDVAGCPAAGSLVRRAALAAPGEGEGEAEAEGAARPGDAFSSPRKGAGRLSLTGVSGGAEAGVSPVHALPSPLPDLAGIAGVVSPGGAMLPLGETTHSAAGRATPGSVSGAGHTRRSGGRAGSHARQSFSRFSLTGFSDLSGIQQVASPSYDSRRLSENTSRLHEEGVGSGGRLSLSGRSGAADVLHSPTAGGASSAGGAAGLGGTVRTPGVPRVSLGGFSTGSGLLPPLPSESSSAAGDATVAQAIGAALAATRTAAAAPVSSAARSPGSVASSTGRGSGAASAGLSPRSPASDASSVFSRARSPPVDPRAPAAAFGAGGPGAAKGFGAAAAAVPYPSSSSSLSSYAAPPDAGWGARKSGNNSLYRLDPEHGGGGVLPAAPAASASFMLGHTLGGDVSGGIGAANVTAPPVWLEPDALDAAAPASPVVPRRSLGGVTLSPYSAGDATLKHHAASFMSGGDATFTTGGLHPVGTTLVPSWFPPADLVAAVEEEASDAAAVDATALTSFAAPSPGIVPMRVFLSASPSSASAGGSPVPSPFPHHALAAGLAAAGPGALAPAPSSSSSSSSNASMVDDDAEAVEPYEDGMHDEEAPASPVAGAARRAALEAADPDAAFEAAGVAAAAACESGSYSLSPCVSVQEAADCLLVCLWCERPEESRGAAGAAAHFAVLRDAALLATNGSAHACAVDTSSVAPVPLVLALWGEDNDCCPLLLVDVPAPSFAEEDVTAAAEHGGVKAAVLSLQDAVPELPANGDHVLPSLPLQGGAALRGLITESTSGQHHQQQLAATPGPFTASLRKAVVGGRLRCLHCSALANSALTDALALGAALVADLTMPGIPAEVTVALGRDACEASMQPLFVQVTAMAARGGHVTLVAACGSVAAQVAGIGPLASLEPGVVGLAALTAVAAVAQQVPSSGQSHAPDGSPLCELATPRGALLPALTSFLLPATAALAEEAALSAAVAAAGRAALKNGRSATAAQAYVAQASAVLAAAASCGCVALSASVPPTAVSCADGWVGGAASPSLAATRARWASALDLKLSAAVLAAFAPYAPGDEAAAVTGALGTSFSGDVSLTLPAKRLAAAQALVTALAPLHPEALLAVLPPALAAEAGAALAAAARGHPIASSLPPVAYGTLGRRDLAALLQRGAGAPSSSSDYRAIATRLLAIPPAGQGVGVVTTQGLTGMPTNESAVAFQQASLFVNAVLGTGDAAGGALPFTDPDGVDAAAAVVGGLRFPGDNRLAATGALLRSCHPRVVMAPRSSELSDHDYMTAQQNLHRFMSRGTLAAPFGRAMLTAGTAFATFTDPVHIPVLTVAGVNPVTNCLMRVDLSAIRSEVSGVTEWPEFANGFAAGLRLALPPAFAMDDWGAAPGGGGKGTSLSAPLPPLAAQHPTPSEIRTWVRSHRFSGAPPDMGAVAATGGAAAAGLPGSSAAGATPAPGVASGLIPPNPAHAGLLLALGVRGLLQCLSGADLYEYLSQTHGTTTVAALLGAAAGKRGSCDGTLTKAIALHLPSLLPGAPAAIEVPSVVQANAMLALGLLYQGSCHGLISAFLQRELVHRVQQGNDQEPGHDAYTGCVGLALGLVHLGRGRSNGAAEEAPHSLTELLINCVRGGPVTPAWAAVAAAVAEATGAAPGVGGDFFSPGSGGTDAAPVHWPQARPPPGLAAYSFPVQVWRRLDVVETSIIASPGALALGLTFLRTNDEAVGAALALPLTLGGLNNVRPDLVALRLGCRAVVMWKEHDDADAARWGPVASSFSGGMGPLEARAAWEAGRRAEAHTWVARQVPPVLRRLVRRLIGKALGTGKGSGAALLARLLAEMTDDAAEAPAGAAANATTAAGQPAHQGGGAAASAPTQLPPSTHAIEGGLLVSTADGALDDLDVALAIMQYACALGGAAWGLGLRFSGSGDAFVRDELMTALQLLALLAAANGDADHLSRLQAHVRSAGAVAAVNAAAAGHALFLELTGAPRFLHPSAAVARANELVYAGVAASLTDPEALLSPLVGPPPGYPLRLAEDGVSLRPSTPAEAAEAWAQALNAAAGAAAAATGTAPPPRVDATALPPLGVLPQAAAAAVASKQRVANLALQCALTGLGLAMAGTGDVASLAILRAAVAPADPETKYGLHLALAQARGFLVLGAGKASLSRSTPSIAALLMSTFPAPYMGTAVADLLPQASKLLWSLALDARCLDAVDVDSGAPVVAAVSVTLKPAAGGHTLSLSTPCLLPERHTIASVAVTGRGGYQPYTLDVGSNPLHAAALWGEPWAAAAGGGGGDKGGVEDLGTAAAAARRSVCGGVVYVQRAGKGESSTATNSSGAAWLRARLGLPQPSGAASK